MNPQ